MLEGDVIWTPSLITVITMQKCLCQESGPFFPRSCQLEYEESEIANVQLIGATWRVRVVDLTEINPGKPRIYAAALLVNLAAVYGEQMATLSAVD